MYFVPRRRWIKVSTMHLSGAAACWLQSVEDEVRAGGWEQFSQLIMNNRFGKDQHELLVRQLFHIYQSGTVQDYIDKYTGLVDQLLAYGRNTDPVYYTMRFVDGLRADIRSAVHMQRPTVPVVWILPACSPYCRKSWWNQGAVVRFAVWNRSPLPRGQDGHLHPTCLHHNELNVVQACSRMAPDRRGRGVEEKLSTLRVCVTIVARAGSASDVVRNGLGITNAPRLSNFMCCSNCGKFAMLKNVWSLHVKKTMKR
jgi:hypothetical protein